MIGKKLSPVLEEMEATLWEYEAFNGAKPKYESSSNTWQILRPEAPP